MDTSKQLLAKQFNLTPDEVNAAIRKADEQTRIAVHRSKDEVARTKAVEKRILDLEQAKYNQELARAK